MGPGLSVFQRDGSVLLADEFAGVLSFVDLSRSDWLWNHRAIMTWRL